MFIGHLYLSSELYVCMISHTTQESIHLVLIYKGFVYIKDIIGCIWKVYVIDGEIVEL